MYSLSTVVIAIKLKAKESALISDSASNQILGMVLLENEGKIYLSLHHKNTRLYHSLFKVRLWEMKILENL